MSHKAPAKFQKSRDPFFAKVSKKQVQSSSSNPNPKSFFVRSKSDDTQVNKKRFDKSKWRTQKYSMKTKLDNWQDKRKEFMRHKYKKEQRKTGSWDVKKIYDEEERRAEQENPSEKEVSQEVGSSTSERKFSDEKEQRKAAILKAKEEREEALKRYKKEKIEKHRKLNKKTKKGQPIMKGRMELLLQKIQKNMTS